MKDMVQNILSVLWISFALFGEELVAASSAGGSVAVFITSNVTLHDGVICYNQPIELTCHVNGTVNVTMYKWTTPTGSKSNQSEYSTSITVIATDDLVEYTCTVTDDNGNHGYSSANISSTASAPVIIPVNFFKEYTVKVGGLVNMTAQVNSSLATVTKWERVHGQLPRHRSNTTNYSKDGNNYTTLFIDKANYTGDGGPYSLTATNQCGTAAVFVNVNIYKVVSCHPNNEPVPVLSNCIDHTAVEGEVVTYKCSFKDNYSFLDYEVFWEVKLEDGSVIIIYDYSNYTAFNMSTYQDCPISNFSCCKFTSALNIRSNLSMDNAVVTCYAMMNELTSSSTCHLKVLKNVDMIILLLLVRTENNKSPPSKNDDWLEDVSQLLERIKPFVQLDHNELNVIYGENLEPDHRSSYLYKVIRERNKVDEVSTLLYGIYYANRDLHHSQGAADSGNQASSPVQSEQEIHHHYYHYSLHINVTKQPNLEDYLPEADDFANPLYQHATDFIRLVDVKMLTPVLIENDLLARDMEYLQLSTIIDSDKKELILAKLIRLGREGYEKFMHCLEDPYDMQHAGHINLYHKLLSQQ